MSVLIYVDKAVYDTWLKVVLVSVLAIPIILAIFKIARNTEEGLAGFGVLLFVIILFRIILPRRFQVYDDKLRIILGGGPFAFNIPLRDIIEIKPRKGIQAFLYTGLRFATSTSHTVEINRKNGLNVLISPANDEVFIEHLNQARKAMHGE
jgi:hypothetical protein